jgi:hypothetical protein
MLFCLSPTTKKQCMTRIDIKLLTDTRCLINYHTAGKSLFTSIVMRLCCRGSAPAKLEKQQQYQNDTSSLVDDLLGLLSDQQQCTPAADTGTISH